MGGMLTLELSPHVLEIPNNQWKADWLLNTQPRVLQADSLILDSNKQKTLNINTPNWYRTSLKQVPLF